MKLLLDTQIAIWVADNDRRLDRGESRLIANNRNGIFVSAITIWEVRIKWATLFKSGTRKLTISPDEVLSFAQRAGWTVIPLTAEHAVATLVQALPHKDPFDELLMVQAQVEGLRLLTRDENLAGHPLALVA